MSRIVRTLREVAEHRNRCARTAQRWRKAGLPKTPAGYDLDAVDHWLEAKPYLGASFKQLEEEAQIQDLFHLAVLDLRRGLQHLCESFIKARGRNRAHLVDRAVRDILHGTMRQGILLEEEGGGAPKNVKPGPAGDNTGPGGEVAP